MNPKILLLLFLLPLFAYSQQETIVHLEAQYQGVGKRLDSILVEDLTAKTEVMIRDLNYYITDYPINLNTLSGIDPYEERIIFETNLPGEARINIASLPYNNYDLQIYDISGKIVASSRINNAGTIDIHIGKSGIYILRLLSAKEVLTCKLVGFPSDDHITIAVSDNHQSHSLKSGANTLLPDDDIAGTLNYQSGDTVRFTVYAAGFHGNIVERIPENGDQYTTYLSKPCACGTVSDYEGNVYETVQIGEQCWMRDNLRSWRYANGESAGLHDDWHNFFYSCKGNYETGFEPVYENGLWYLWTTSTKRKVPTDTISNVIQGICPYGWHVPSDQEWMELERYLGIAEAELNIYGYRGVDEAKRIKEAGTINWIGYDFNWESTNETGLNVIGCRHRGIEGFATFWTSSQDHIEEILCFPIYRKIEARNNRIYKNFDITWETPGEASGTPRCVRCIKNNF